MKSIAAILFSILLFTPSSSAQEVTDVAPSKRTREEEVQQGSQTAKGGFRNEDEILNKFNRWKTDSDARAWLEAMKYSLEDVVDVVASKPHGEKADVEVRVKTTAAERVEGISIKLVSNPRGFNQIDKRWLATYATKWRMPAEVHDALKLFVGERPPIKPGRNSERMFLDELDSDARQAVLEFFVRNRDEIVSDLFVGDGQHAAAWMMATLKESNNNRSDEDGTVRAKASNGEDVSPNTVAATRWTIHSTADAVKFYGDGEVRITNAGSLKIGRITMQRKGGDNGRESARMLQFKINPAELFDFRDISPPK